MTSKSKTGKRAGNRAPLPPPVNAMLKHARLDELSAYAEKHYGLALDPSMGPEAMKAKILEVVRSRAAAKAEQEAQAAAVIPPPAPAPAREAQPQSPTADDVAAATEAQRQTEIDALPKDPWIVSGRKPGKAPSTTGVYNEKGVMLLPDTDPVLSDAEYAAELKLTDPRFSDSMDKETMAAMEKMPEHLRPKPAKPPFRHSTNPCIPRAFLNPNSGVYFRPTEILMRNPALVPVYDTPPVDATYGT